MSQRSRSIDGELAKLVLHNPPQNRLTQALFAELGEAMPKSEDCNADAVDFITNIVQSVFDDTTGDASEQQPRIRVELVVSPASRSIRPDAMGAFL
jgi:hypothetical protein